MQSAPIPQTLQDVRPVVRNMRPEGYILQTGGSATRKEIKMEGSQSDPLFRVTGVPLHTHNATALLSIDVRIENDVADDAARDVSLAGEFSVDDLTLDVGDLVESYSRDDYKEDVERLQRSIEFGVGNVQLQPENCVNHISEPTRAIAEIRTLVCSSDALKTMTFVDQKFAYTDRKGNGVDIQFPQTVMVPVLPTNNIHVESNFASRLLADAGEEQLHLEFYTQGHDTANLKEEYMSELWNDWGEPVNSRSALHHDNDSPFPFPVGLVGIGTGSPVLIRPKGASSYVDWDGRLPYTYSEELSRYDFDGPVFLKFSNFRCTSNGQLSQHTLLTGGTAAQKKKINVFNNPGEHIIFQVTGAPETYRHEGYFYVNGQMGRNTWAPSRRSGRYKHPRIIVAGRWITREEQLGNAGATTFRTDGAHDPVYGTLFFGNSSCWHAPMVRWAVGSDVALSGPQLSKMNLDDTLDADDFYNPADFNVDAYSSAFQVLTNTVKPLVDSKTLEIEDGPSFEKILRMVASSRTRYIQIANGTLQDHDDDANEEWAAAFPVPFRAGMYPFPADHRFLHQAAQQMGSATGLAAVKDDVNAGPNLYISPAQAGARIIERSAGLRYRWTLGAGFATNDGNDSYALLGLIGHRDDRTNVLAKIHETKKDYSPLSAQAAYEAKLAEGTLAFKESAMSIVWSSEFGSDAGHRRICPCELLVADPSIHYEAADGGHVDLNFQLNQYPFFRTSFDKPGLKYRGGYHVNTAQVADPVYFTPHEPCVGNIFAYGLDPSNDAAGAVPSVRSGNAQNVQMFVQVLVAPGGDAKRGILRVTGLAFDPKLDTRTLFFYYGGVQGGDEDKQLYWSEPGDLRKTALNQAAAVGDQSAAIVQECWVTDIYVRSHDDVVVKAKTEVANADAFSHLYVAVVAPRAEGLFHPERASAQALMLEASLDTGNIYAPHFEVTQPLTAPIISPDFRNNCIEPLDQMTAFLPPELRDFRLILGDMDWRHVSDKQHTVTVKRLIFSEFNGGNQQVASLPSLLSVPEFRQHKVYIEGPGRTVQTVDFDTEIFTPMGPPCFWCVFARSDDGPNYGQQPIVDQLTFTCMTTGKKSDTIQNAGKAELFFMTRRNCHKNANYTDAAFKERQVILLRSEDVGTMGINPRLYQREKRVRYRIQGTCRWPRDSTVSIILAYTNRGLQIAGKEISVQYL